MTCITVKKKKEKKKKTTRCAVAGCQRNTKNIYYVDKLPAYEKNTLASTAKK